MGESAAAAFNTSVFRDAFDASPIGIAIENLDGQPLFVNPAFCRFLGFTEEELRRKHCVDFSPKEDAEKDWALFQQLRAGSIDHYQLEKRYFRRDGSLVWGRLSLSLLNSRPSPLIIAMVEDITDKKKAEEAQRDSEKRLLLAQQAAGIGTFERDVRTGRITWAEGLEPLYGLPPGSLDGKSLSYFFNDLLHPADRERAADLIQQALETGQPTEGEWRAIWPDRSVHWIVSRWQVLMDDSGEPSRVVGVNMDVTERKRTEEALIDLNRMLEAKTASLQSQEKLLKTFVKNVPVAVAMLDRETRYLQVSDRWCSDNSVEASALLGQLREKVPEMPERWKEVNRRALQGETLRANEERWESGGRTRWARWEVRPWRNSDSTVGGILVFAEDITHRKQMEDELLDMSRKLIESQEQERSRIGRDLHDDVNQRLALLNVELEQLKENPSEVGVRVSELRKQLTDISNDVQALSHDLHSSQLDYLGAVAGIKSWCKEFSDRQGMQIDCTHDVQSTLPREIGLCLFRVLQEALHNAVKHSGVKRIEVELSEDSGSIHLTIRDLGKGFDVETAKQGRGLGLTSMGERVRLVNGTITIDSKPMGGTTIHVRLPLELGREAQRAAG